MKKKQDKIIDLFITTPLIVVGGGTLVAFFFEQNWLFYLLGSSLMVLGVMLGYTGRDIEVLDGDTDPVLGDLFKKGETVPEESR